MVDHTTLQKGMYVSRRDADVTTYDVRMKRPNTPPYIEPAAAHTFEHLFAVFARNSRFGSSIIYVGPMGCRTGFYLLTRNLSDEDAITLAHEAMNFIAEFTDQIPGATPKECGNYLEHDLDGAKSLARDMAIILKDWKITDLNY
jgi:S-ribosylhomocysteine lyase